MSHTDLEAALARVNLPASDETDGSPPAGAQSAPEAPATPTGEETAGENLESGEPKPDGAETPAGETETVLSQSELQQAVAGLPPELQEHLAKVIAERPGEIPRISKLLTEKHQAEATIETLQAELDELKESRVVTSAATATAALPEAVTKLKTVEAVEAELDRVSTDIEQLTDFLDANPGSLEAEYQVGDKTFTRQQLINRRADLRVLAKALPKQAQALTHQAQFKTARTEAVNQLVRDYPQWNDANHADVKLAKQLAKLPQFAREQNGDYLALAVATGDRVLKAELAARSRNGKPTLPATKPAGKVPAAKPHVAVAAAAPSGAGLKTFQAALPKPGVKVKGADLERVLASLPA